MPQTSFYRVAIFEITADDLEHAEEIWDDFGPESAEAEGVSQAESSPIGSSRAEAWKLAIAGDDDARTAAIAQD